MSVRNLLLLWLLVALSMLFAGTVMYFIGVDKGYNAGIMIAE